MTAHLTPATRTMPCTVTASAISSEFTAVVVGHCSARLPRLVESQAARVAKGEANAPLALLTPEGRYLLLKLEEKPWLTGGEPWRMLGKQVVDAVREAKLAAATILVGGKLADVQALAEGLVLADYRFTTCRSGKDAKRTPITISLPGHQQPVQRGVQVGNAQNLARELTDMPPNMLTTTAFAQRAVNELRDLGAQVVVTSGAVKLRKAGFPGLAQVGEAGSTPPALVEIRWRPRKPTRKGQHLALVGKGLCFDAGGISIKPADKMWEMKGDMAGAAAVLAAARLLIMRKVPVTFTAYLCLAENLIDRTAQRPGDIYQARNGKWIHVDNTDAEGRLVLADVMTYACEKGATHLIDVATLTGACMVALGDRIGGVMGRKETLPALVRAAGQEVGEEFWPLPLFGEYRSYLDHPHADLNNVGGRYGGAITAGLFLGEFVPEQIHWAHLDIAGPAIQSGGWRYYTKGMTGFATRTLVRVVEKLV